MPQPSASRHRRPATGNIPVTCSSSGARSRRRPAVTTFSARPPRATQRPRQLPRFPNPQRNTKTSRRQKAKNIITGSAPSAADTIITTNPSTTGAIARNRPHPPNPARLLQTASTAIPSSVTDASIRIALSSMACPCFRHRSDGAARRARACWAPAVVQSFWRTNVRPPRPSKSPSRPSIAKRPTRRP